MPRRISFGPSTVNALLDGSKTVTRRRSWLDLTAGTRLTAVDRVMGLKKGERATVYGDIDVVDVRRERIDAITADDVKAEGFPDWSPDDFVQFYCREFDVGPDAEVTRIEFRPVAA